ncbi:hypothetical protein GF407_14770 [candidate division KSB1 bacterium]|nr:hypothetical protein [candidate division KSB1 bacterium]
MPQKQSWVFVRNRKKVIIVYSLVLFPLLLFCFCNQGRKSSAYSNADFAQQACRRVLEPVHRGIPGVRPFWNKHSVRFIYAPAFDFAEHPDATCYRFIICSKTDSSVAEFKAVQPWMPLTPVWNRLADDSLSLTVEALDAPDGKTIETVGRRDLIKSTPFAGINNKPAYPYRQSGFRTLKALLHEEKVQYWLKHGRPDPSYPLWCHPTKIMSALIIGMIHYAEYFPQAADRDQAVEIAAIVADFLLSMAQIPGSPLEYWPPSYWDGVPRENHPYFHGELMTNTPAIAAEMLLDFYDFSKNDAYFTAARRIADTYAKTQEAGGTWPQLVSFETGEAVKPHKLVPTMVIELYDRFLEQYLVADYQDSRQKAFNWIMQNPMQTFNWQAQFEDTRPRSRYKNLSREEPSEFARILLKSNDDHPEYIDMARELIRFAEDQFVVWESTDPVLGYPWFAEDSKWNGTTRPGGCDWFIPCTMEQYVFYTPIARSSQLMILTYLKAYKGTGEAIYHAKAVALANALTRAQEYHGGGLIPTHLRKNLPEANWINNAVYPAITLIEQADILSNGPS